MSIENVKAMGDLYSTVSFCGGSGGGGGGGNESAGRVSNAVGRAGLMAGCVAGTTVGIVNAKSGTEVGLVAQGGLACVAGALGMTGGGP